MQQRAAIPIEFVISCSWKFLDQDIPFVPCLARFFLAAFNPEKRTLRQPVIRAEMGRFLGFHALPPLSRAGGIAAQKCHAINKRQAKFGGKI